MLKPDCEKLDRPKAELRTKPGGGGRQRAKDVPDRGPVELSNGLGIALLGRGQAEHKTVLFFRLRHVEGSADAVPPGDKKAEILAVMFRVSTVVNDVQRRADKM